MKYTSQNGFSLAEMILAIFIIAITSTGAFIMTTMSIRSQVVGHDYTIATNLAREGIEIVRGVRDTNWLYYSGSKRSASGNPARDHWNDGFDGVDSFGNDYNELAVEVGNNLTDNVSWDINQVTNYFIPIIDYSSALMLDKYQWGLKFIGTDLGGGDLYPTDLEYTIYRLSDAAGGLYIQDDDLAGTAPVGGEVTKFYRIIEIRFQESYDQGGLCKPENNDSASDSLADEDPPFDYNGDGDVDDDGDGTANEDGFDGSCKLNANDNKILVRSKVIWYDYQGNKLHVDIDTILTDWFRRGNHN